MTTLDANGHEVNLAQRDLHGPDGCEDEDVVATLEFEYQPDLPVEAHNLVGWARLRLETHGDLLAAADVACRYLLQRGNGTNIRRNANGKANANASYHAMRDTEQGEALLAAIAKAKEVE